MKLPRLFLCLALLAPVSTATAEEAAPLSAAVLDFREAEPALEGMGASVTALLQVKL